MIAIETRYVGPTDTKGARIIATTCNGHRLTLPYDHSGDEHRKAAEALANKHGWLADGTRLEGGGTKAGYCWVFVLTETHDPAPEAYAHIGQPMPICTICSYAHSADSHGLCIEHGLRRPSRP